MADLSDTRDGSRNDGRRFLAGGLGAFLASAIMCSGASAQLSSTYRDADIGGSIDFVLQAPPGTTYVNILSLSEGPSCFGPKHPVGCIDVDMLLLYLSFAIPGFFGVMGGSGEVVTSVGIPNDPILDGIVLNQQMVSLVSGKFTEKSDLCKIIFRYPDTWSHALESMASDAYNVPAIELDTGRILLAGGYGANFDQCELYDPLRQSMSAADSLANGRAGHTVTKLQDGRVLVVGGSDFNQVVTPTAELYDAATDTWTLVGSLATARAGHTASLLPNGQVLISGGTDDVTDAVAAALGAQKTTELFDPGTLTFSAGPTLIRPHVGHFATTLANGDVLLGGGATWRTLIGIPIPDLTDKAQTYSASGGTWSTEVTMRAARIGPGSILLADGRVLLAGGIGGSITSLTNLSSSETYDPAANTFTTRGAMSLARSLMTMLLMPGTNLVLVAGGSTGTDPTAPVPTDLAEMFDPTSNLFSAVATMLEPRAAAGGIVQRDNHAVLFGGAGVATEPAIYRD